MPDEVAVPVGSPRLLRRTPRLLAALAFAACLGLVVAPLTDPSVAISIANAEEEPLEMIDPGQTLTAEEGAILAADRAQFGVTRLQVRAPAAGTPDPGTAQAVAYEMVVARGWGDSEWSCLVSLWNRESHWNVYAHNTRTDAYGIPQAMPGSKMASAGSDWQTNPATQITWGLGYITGRYGTPCGAWTSSETRGWY